MDILKKNNRIIKVFFIKKIMKNKIPYFESKWKDKPRRDKKTVKRKNVSVIIEHPIEEKYLLLDWEKFGWKSFIVWWVEDDENYEDAWIREVIEETWYNDFENIKLITWEMHDNFYAAHKWINRYSIDKIYFIRYWETDRNLNWIINPWDVIVN